MIKRILIAILCCMALAYVFFSVSWLCNPLKEAPLVHPHCVFPDSAQLNLMSSEDVLELLKDSLLLTDSTTLHTVDMQLIETTLVRNPLIKEAMCYHATNGDLFVEVYQRHPLFRVMTHTGDSYFVDTNCDSVPTMGKAVSLPLVTGYVTKEMIDCQLYAMMRWIAANDFWASQIEQIDVMENGALQIIPRVGDHIIDFGFADEFEEKFVRLKKFYTFVLNKVGWNKYSRISLDINNQIVCKIK
ncbi:MAG: hypothetical protein Q4E55_05915 [Bacteroidales bacterium]|nr:hypothetical protein [Bacteroidales bacterium]